MIEFCACLQTPAGGTQTVTVRARNDQSARDRLARWYPTARILWLI